MLTAIQAEFDLHLTGEHVREHFTLEVGAANRIPRKSVKTSRLLVPGYFANVYEGTMKQVDGTIVPVAIKALRQVDMRSSRSPEAKNERMNKVRFWVISISYPMPIEYLGYAEVEQRKRCVGSSPAS